MSRILLAWELGGNFGHVAPLRSLAQALRDLGHETVFAVRDLGAAETFLGGLGAVFQAPRPPEGSHRPVKVQVSYASLLHNTGFDDPASLAGRLRAWRQLMLALRVDAVIANHAPVALIAAQTLDLPRGQIGTGFCIPPVQAPFPSFQPDLRFDPAILSHNEQQVLAELNTALAKLGIAPFANLQQIFAGSEASILGYPELDPYEVPRAERFCGRPDLSHGAPPQWPTAAGPRLFGYLRPFPHLQPLLKALQASRLPALLYVAGIAAETLRPFQRPGLQFSPGPVHLRMAAEQCDAMLHYAPDGTTSEMLLAGKPGLLLPTDLEKGLVARSAQRQGAAIVDAGKDEALLAQQLQRLVEDVSLRSAAEAFAARYRHQDRAAIMPEIAARFARRL